MHQVIARAWRPQRFSEVVGQRHVTQTLQNAVRLNRVGHGYVFSGQRGVGKTTVARLLAKALNCHKGPAPEPCGECDSCREIAAGRSVDVLEIDAASNRGIDAVRELRENVRYATARDRYKVFIIDEAHQITPEGFNALLKTLEEPPPHVVFILATTELHELPETILSRCQSFSFHAASFTEVLEDLRKISAAEGIQTDEQALAALASAAGGSLRDAQSRLEQAIAAFGNQLEGPAVLRLLGAVPAQLIEEVFSAVQDRARARILEAVSRLVDEGYQLPHFCSQLVRWVRNMLVTKVAGAQAHLVEASTEEAAKLAALAEKFSEEDLLRFLEILLQLHQQLRYTMDPRFSLELGLLKLVEAERLVEIEKLISGGEIAGEKPAGEVGRGSPGSRAETESRAQSGGGAGPTQQAQQAASRSGSVAALPGLSASPASSPAPAGGLSPFERDTLRKRVSVPEEAPPERAPAPAVSASPQENWSHEVMRRLESQSRHGLTSLLEGSEWEFGEGDVRLQPPTPAIAAVLSEGDRKLLEQLISEVSGRRLRLSVVEGGAGAGKRPAARPPGRTGSGTTEGAAASASGSDADVRQDPEVQEFERLFGTPVTGIRKRRE